MNFMKKLFSYTTGSFFFSLSSLFRIALLIIFSAIIFLAIFLSVFLTIQPLQAAEENIPVDNGFVALRQIIDLNKNIIFKTDYLEKVFSLTYKNNSVRFELDKKFLISSGYFIPVQHSAKWKNNQVYVSKEMAEEILSELSLPIKYNFLQKNLTVKSFKESGFVPPKNKLKFIVIDPGHGGLDSGAIGATKQLEKDIVLSISTSLFYYLRKQFPKLSIYITRLDDTYLSLPKRSEIANKKNRKDGYGIFISIHCNATFSADVAGYEIYYLSQNYKNNMTRQLSLKENSFYITGSDLYARVLQTFLLNAQIQKESKVLAREMNKAFMSKMDSLVSSRGIRKADFSVLRSTLMPAILIETGYITNAKEEQLLKTANYRKHLNKTVAEGIRNYIKVTEHD